MPGSLSQNITDDKALVSCDDRHIESRGAPPCSREAAASLLIEAKGPSYALQIDRIRRPQSDRNQDIRRRHVRVRTALAHGGHGVSATSVHAA